VSPFAPVGERARWRIVYDLIRKRDIGDLVSYEELADVVDLDPVRDRHTIQVSVRRAARESEEEDCRALEAVPGAGYRLVEPEEHLRLARGYQRRSSRALARGRRVATHVDLSGMDPDTRRAFEVVAEAFRMQSEFNRRLDVRQRQVEDVVAAVTVQQDRSVGELAEIRDRLARLERRARAG